VLYAASGAEGDGAIKIAEEESDGGRSRCRKVEEKVDMGSDRGRRRPRMRRLTWGHTLALTHDRSHVRAAHVF
jgi:hypothetical protein